MWFFLIIFYSNISKGLRIKSCPASLAYLVGTLYYICMWSEFELRSSYLTTKVKFQITKKNKPHITKVWKIKYFSYIFELSTYQLTEILFHFSTYFFPMGYNTIFRNSSVISHALLLILIFYFSLIFLILLISREKLLNYEIFLKRINL
jgi:hypothetical protein